jgi:hypothetical protein
LPNLTIFWSLRYGNFNTGSKNKKLPPKIMAPPLFTPVANFFGVPAVSCNFLIFGQVVEKPYDVL